MKKRSTTYRLNKVDYSIFIICSLAAAFTLYLFYRDLNSYTIKQSEEPVAKIYFKRNTAQRKFLDNDIWEVLTNSSDIYDGDRIRTSKDSEAYTEFNDSGIQIQLREKSMVQIFKNKKQRSVDFIGGEIFVATTKPEETIVIHSGKNEISIGQVSEVKLALPEVSAAAAAGAEEAEESPVVIEVLSGQVEVIEQPVETKGKKEKTEPVPMVVSAGETVTLIPQVEEKKPLTEEAPPLVQVSEPEPLEETVEEDEENIAEEAPAPIKEEKTSLPIVQPSQPVVEPVVIPPEPISVGVERTYSKGTDYFARNNYDRENGKYNYSLGCNLFEVSEKNKTIPAGAALEFTMKGTVNRDISRWAIQISTGEEEWIQAHPFKSSYGNDGSGIKANVPFTYTTVYILDKPIVNTNSSWVNICYDPDVLDASALITDLQVSAKVLSVDGGNKTSPVTSGYSKTLEYDEFTLVYEKWGEGKNDYHYLRTIETEGIFGSYKTIPKGTKIKITISGTSDLELDCILPEIINISDEWDEVFEKEEGFNRNFNEDGNIKKNKNFSYSKVYEFQKDLYNTESGYFRLIASYNKTNNPPTLKNLKITFEVE